MKCYRCCNWPCSCRDGQTIIHGDCLESMLELEPESVDAVVTDPPYCSGGATEASRGAATHQGLRSETIRSGRFKWFSSDNMTTAGLCWLMRAMVANAPVKGSGHVLAFCDWRMVPLLAPVMESGGWRYRNCLVWDKGHFGCGTGFRPQHEMILHLCRQSSEFFSKSVGNVLRVKRVGAEREHPTEKPVDLIVKLLSVVSDPDGVVLDPFMGSGTTLAACKQEGRRGIGIEVSEEYCEIAANRLRQGVIEWPEPVEESA